MKGFKKSLCVLLSVLMAFSFGAMVYAENDTSELIVTEDTAEPMAEEAVAPEFTAEDVSDEDATVVAQAESIEDVFYYTNYRTEVDGEFEQRTIMIINFYSSCSLNSDMNDVRATFTGANYKATQLSSKAGDIVAKSFHRENGRLCPQIFIRLPKGVSFTESDPTKRDFTVTITKGAWRDPKVAEEEVVVRSTRMKDYGFKFILNVERSAKPEHATARFPVSWRFTTQNNINELYTPDLVTVIDQTLKSDEKTVKSTQTVTTQKWKIMDDGVHVITLALNDVPFMSASIQVKVDSRFVSYWTNVFFASVDGLIGPLRVIIGLFNLMFALKKIEAARTVKDGFVAIGKFFSSLFFAAGREYELDSITNRYKG